MQKQVERITKSYDKGSILQYIGISVAKMGDFDY